MASSIVFSVDGNIGSGKSTLVSELEKVLSVDKFSGLAKFTNIIFLQEPVDVWKTIKDREGTTILEKFYKDQKEWSFAFQMMAYISRLSLLKKTIKENPNSIIITERSVYTDRHVFAKMLFDSKKINDIEYAIYLKWFDDFVEEAPIDGIIYVNVSPENCLSRVEKRGRKGETIPLEYLKECGQYHNDWLDEGLKTKSYLEIDGNVDLEKHPTMTISWIKDIVFYIESTISKKTEMGLFSSHN